MAFGQEGALSADFLFLALVPVIVFLVNPAGRFAPPKDARKNSKDRPGRG